MHESSANSLCGDIVEEQVQLTRSEFCRACDIRDEHLDAWVFDGVIEPTGRAPGEWLFAGASLHRARVALRLTRDLEVNPPGVALVLGLLEQIGELKSRLQRQASRGEQQR